MPKSPVYILVAEDDKYYAHIFQLKLEKEGFEVKVVSDGEQALAAMHARPPRILLLDLIMPVMDGFETLKQLKGDKKLAKIPVIVFSNLGQDDDKEKAKKLGAVDYLVKADISVQQMVEVVKRYLK